MFHLCFKYRDTVGQKTIFGVCVNTWIQTYDERASTTVQSKCGATTCKAKTARHLQGGGGSVIASHKTQIQGRVPLVKYMSWNHHRSVHKGLSSQRTISEIAKMEWGILLNGVIHNLMPLDQTLSAGPRLVTE